MQPQVNVDFMTHALGLVWLWDIQLYGEHAWQVSVSFYLRI